MLVYQKVNQPYTEFFSIVHPVALLNVDASGAVLDEHLGQPGGSTIRTVHVDGTWVSERGK